MSEETVLIIDDSDELRALLESILPYGGYRTVSAATGQEGLELVLEIEPDALLVDLELPDTTGLKILEELNKRELEIPTIMMTGYGSEGVAARALRLGAVGYLIKPFTTEEVLGGVEKALAVRRLHREKVHLATMVDAYTRHFKTISAIGQVMTTGLDLDQILQRIVEAGLFMTRAERCLLSALDRDSTHLQILAVGGKASDANRQFPARAGDERLQTAFDKGIAVRLCALSNSTIALQSGSTAKVVLQVPLKAQGNVVGLLSVDRQGKGTPFGKHDEEMLIILAHYAVMALEQHQKLEPAQDPTPNP